MLRTGQLNRRVSARRTAEALERLRAAGWSWPKLAAASGFAASTLVGVRAHPERRCWSLVERAVLELVS